MSIAVDRELDLSSVCELEISLAGEVIYSGSDFSIKWSCQKGWQTSFGVRLFAREEPNKPRATRITFRPGLSPTAYGFDPSDPNRQMFFNIVDVSSDGFKATTSITNRALLPGMSIRNATLFFPGSSEFNEALIIRWAKYAVFNGQPLLYVGFKLKERSETFTSAAAKFSVVFANIDSIAVKLAAMRENDFPFKDIRTALSYRIACRDSEYREVLTLRYQGYRYHDKVADDATEDDMGDGLMSEGIVLAAYLKNQCVASCELRIRSIHKSMKHDKHLKAIGYEYGNVCEVNKLVVLPELQGTDVVLGMVQRIQAILFCNNQCDLVISATDQLLPFYLRMGFRDLKMRYPHPVLQSTTLNVLVMDKETYTTGLGLSASRWNQLYSSIANFMKIGFTTLPREISEAG